jgi:hypothetical protein
MPLHPKKCLSIECDVDGRRLEDDDGAEFRLDGLEEAVIIARQFGAAALLLAAAADRAATDREPWTWTPATDIGVSA